MEAKNKSVCPFCGATVICTDIDWGDNCDEFAFCGKCGMRGPAIVGGFDDAIDAFCHPAHLMENLYTYDPRTHVVVSRETAEVAKSSCIMCANGKPDEIRPAVYELRAAMEGK